MHRIPLFLLISLFQIFCSTCQPLDLPERKSCDVENLRHGSIRQMRWAGEKIRDLQSLYDRTVKTNNYLQTQNFRLLEWYRNASNDGGLSDLCMNALNESVLQGILLTEMESENDVLKSEKYSLDLQVKTLESEKDQSLKELKSVRNFLTEASNNKPGFCHLSDDRMFFIPWSKKTWSESEKFCRLLNGSLAKMLDETMNTNMRNRLSRLNPLVSYWIGGIRKGFGDEWRWVGSNSNREPIRWFGWAPDEPNDVKANCIQMWKDSDFQWDNAYCNFQQRFICEKPLF